MLSSLFFLFAWAVGIFTGTTAAVGSDARVRFDQDPPAIGPIIQGSVIDAVTRAPIAGVEVVAQPGGADAGAKRTVQTDQWGRFRFDGLPPRSFSITAAGKGYLPSLPRAVTLRAGETETLALALEPMARLSGRVLDESRRPLGEIILKVLRKGERGTEGMPSGPGVSLHNARTDAKGTFDLFVPAGALTLLAQSGGYVVARESGLRLKPGEIRSGLLLRLRRGLEATGSVVAEDGKAIKGVTVAAHLERGEGAPGGFAEEDTLAASATTGDDGSFRLRGLEAATYRLVASHPAHVRQVVSGVEIKAPGPNQIARVEKIERIVLAPAVAISGRVSNQSGDPIPGAEIRVFRIYGEEGVEEQARTDDAGRFTLARFGSGERLAVSARAPGYNPAHLEATAPEKDIALTLERQGALRGRVEDAESRLPVTDFRLGLVFRSAEELVEPEIPGARSFHSADGSFEWADAPPTVWTVVARADGYQTAELHEIEVRSGEVRDKIVFSLKRGVKLQGRVVAASSGLPVPDATVSHREAGEPETDGRIAGIEDSVHTDAEGNFTLDGLPPKKLTLTAREASHTEASRDVEAGKESFVELKLGAGATISGQALLSDRRTPATGVEVIISAAGASLAGAETAARTDGAGRFSFARLQSGRYRLSAQGEQGVAATQELMLQEGKPRSGVTLVLIAGSTLRGTVRGLAAGELANVQISALADEGFRAMTFTNQAGEFMIRGVPAGTAEITAGLLSPQRSVARTVEIPEGTPEMAVEIEFPAGGRLSGRVTRGGQPVARHSVSATAVNQEGNFGVAQTDESGGYLIRGLSRGEYLVEAGAGKARRVRVEGDVQLDLELPSASLSGRVGQSGSGEPVADAQVELQAAGQPSFNAISDGAGRFRLAALDEGSYRMSVHKRGFKVHTETVSISGTGSEVGVTLERAEGTIIEVKDEITGAPLRDVRIEAYSGAGRLSLGQVTLDQAGRGELPQLSPGRYGFLVTADGYAPRRLDEVSVPGPPIRIPMTAGGSLEIRLDPSRLGVEAGLVDAGGRPALGEQAFTLSRSRIVLRYIAPGNYSLWVAFPEGRRTYPARVVEGTTTIIEAR